MSTNTDTKQVTLGAAIPDTPGSDNASPTQPVPDISGRAASVRAAIVEAVGEAELADYELDGGVAGEDETLMWFPGHTTDPLAFGLSVFVDDTEWELGYVDIDGEERAVFGVSDGDAYHVVDAEMVHTVAKALDTDTRPSDILDTAAIHPEKSDFPVLFDLPTGRAVIAPIYRTREDVRAASEEYGEDESADEATNSKTERRQG